MKCTTVETKAITEQSRRVRNRTGTGQIIHVTPPELQNQIKKIHFSFCLQHILLAVSPPLVGGLIDCVAQNFNFACKCQEVVLWPRGGRESPPLRSLILKEKKKKPAECDCFAVWFAFCFAFGRPRCCSLRFGLCRLQAFLSQNGSARLWPLQVQFRWSRCCWHLYSDSCSCRRGKYANAAF